MTTRTNINRFIALTMALAAASAAHAQTAPTLINDYSAIVFGNVTSSSEMDGAALVLGTVAGGGYDQHQPVSSIVGLTAAGLTSSLNPTTSPVLTGSITLQGGLALGGNLTDSSVTSNSGNVYISGNVTSSFNPNLNGSKLYIGGAVTSPGKISANNGNIYVATAKSANTGSVATNGGKTVTYSDAVVTSAAIPNTKTEVSSAQTTLDNYATGLSAMATSGTATLCTAANNNTCPGAHEDALTFKANANAGSVVIIDVAASVLNQATYYNFSLNSNTKELIINVTGAALSNGVTLNAGYVNGNPQSLAGDTLFNFGNQTKVTVKSQFGGDILATMANVNVNADLEGSVIAKSLTQTAEIHYDSAQKYLPSAVPVPGALPLFASALVGVGIAGRRRAKKSAQAA